MAFRESIKMNAATAATANHVCAQLWNPHASKSLWVTEIKVVITAATACEPAVVRTTARGATPGNTVTPAAESDTEGDTTPLTGAVLEGAAFGTQPTLQSTTNYLERWSMPANVGASMMWIFPEGVRVKAGLGLAVVTATAIAFPISTIQYTWRE